ncbi:uncharacterized protein BDZ99DRAFT_99953 [Mytilinidion resinicola]|uniref:F-box domain-containing protein n=1 Tax=Mytilinidion resinicola TaxID=574789 RepID=A0A6A6YB75_9PEZI|nr:uncharacterized protein BDZ99DRAFT_99953 [Mytilinidion resinicola]KAF2805869.1 hypothetical protein BDZ99DRAFT_99953 [Mytilinidion resinicola]
MPTGVAPHETHSEACRGQEASEQRNATSSSITMPRDPNGQQACSQVRTTVVHRDIKSTLNHKQQAAAIHNATQVPIHQLPYELLLMISVYLSPVANMAMHQTCQRMMDVFTLLPGTFPLNDFDPESLWLENTQSARIWCSVCERRHAFNLFFASQRTRPPFERCCVKMDEAVRICEHQWCTFSEISESRYGEVVGPIRCEDASHCFTHWPDHWRPTLTLDGQKAKITSYISIITLPKGDAISDHDLKTALKTSTEPVCVHLSLYDPVIFNLVSKLIHARHADHLKWYRSEETPCVHGGYAEIAACSQWHVSEDESDFLVSQGAWISDWWEMDCRKQLAILLHGGGEAEWTTQWGCPCNLKVFLRRLPGADVEEVIMEVCREWTRTSMDQDWLETIGYGPGGLTERPRSGVDGIAPFPFSAEPWQVRWARTS